MSGLASSQPTKSPGHLVGKGWLKLDFDRLILPDGIAPVSVRVIAVSGFKVDTEAEHSIRTISFQYSSSGKCWELKMD